MDAKGATPDLAVGGELKAKYDPYYRGESEWRRICAVDKVRNIQELTRGYSFRDVVEVGAGEGSVLARLDELAFAPNLYALEISDSGLAAIRSRAFPPVRSVDAFDGYHVPCEDDRFDLAIASHVLEHVEHERLFLRELARIARYVLVEVPLEDTWRMVKALDNEIGRINFYRPETVISLLRTAGLNVLARRVFDVSVAATVFRSGTLKGVSKYLLRRALLRAAPGLAPHVFTYHFGVLATRDRT